MPHTEITEITEITDFFIPKTSKNSKRPEKHWLLPFSGKYAVFVHFVHFFG